MAKITIESDGKFYVMRKARGKLSLDEITEFLQLENHGHHQGQYAILINATESAMGGSGWGMEETPKGDVVELILLNGEEPCPICTEMLPPDYCPECGATLGKEAKEK